MFKLEEIIAEEVRRILEQDFGKYLFGQDLGLPNKNKPEPNTPDEYDLQDDISDHYAGSMEKLTPWIPTLVKLRDQGKYTNILKVPNKYKSAYRVMGNVPVASLTKMIGYEPTDFEPEEVYYEDNINYIALPDINHSSWTVDFNAIEEMLEDWYSLSSNSYKTMKQQQFFVILSADVASNNFLMNPDVTSFLSKHYDYQREIISVGNVKCNRIWYVSYNHKQLPDDKKYIDKINSVR